MLRLNVRGIIRNEKATPTFTKMQLEKIVTALTIKRHTVDPKNDSIDILENTLENFPVQNNPRIGVICYIPQGDHQAQQYLAMLFGSWQYITENKEKLVDIKEYHHDIDLLAFCHPSVCPLISHVCDTLDQTYNNTMISGNCWAITQSFESKVPYGPINSFIMFKRDDIVEITSPYKFLMRTDFDVFVTPTLFTWLPNPNFHIMVGKGGYCDPFNMKRLKEIAKKLKLRHQGVHCVGSTWYGETDLFIKLSRKTLELTGHMYMNEFHPDMPGLETIPLKANPEGEWIRWWRPVSLLYGAELATNDLIDAFSTKYKGELDTTSCTQQKLAITPHIHCWHNDCEFQKFKFMDYLSKLLQKKDVPGVITHNIVKSVYTHDIKEMLIPDYAAFIAWRSVGRYMQKWILK